MHHVVDKTNSAKLQFGKLRSEIQFHSLTDGLGSIQGSKISISSGSESRRSINSLKDELKHAPKEEKKLPIIAEFKTPKHFFLRKFKNNELVPNNYVPFSHRNNSSKPSSPSVDLEAIRPPRILKAKSTLEKLPKKAKDGTKKKKESLEKRKKTPPARSSGLFFLEEDEVLESSDDSEDDMIPLRLSPIDSTLQKATVNVKGRAPVIKGLMQPQAEHNVVELLDTERDGFVNGLLEVHSHHESFHGQDHMEEEEVLFRFTSEYLLLQMVQREAVTGVRSVQFAAQITALKEDLPKALAETSHTLYRYLCTMKKVVVTARVFSRLFCYYQELKEKKPNRLHHRIRQELINLLEDQDFNSTLFFKVIFGHLARIFRHIPCVSSKLGALFLPLVVQEGWQAHLPRKYREVHIAGFAHENHVRKALEGNQKAVKLWQMQLLKDSRFQPLVINDGDSGRETIATILQRGIPYADNSFDTMRNKPEKAESDGILRPPSARQSSPLSRPKGVLKELRCRASAKAFPRSKSAAVISNRSVDDPNYLPPMRRNLDDLHATSVPQLAKEKEETAIPDYKIVKMTLPLDVFEQGATVLGYLIENNDYLLDSALYGVSKIKKLEESIKSSEGGGRSKSLNKSLNNRKVR
jgi:hypothetical protein